MIDIHAHILPGVDDGSRSAEMSVTMLREAYESGVTAIAATPHCNIPGEFGNYWDDVFAGRYRELRDEAKREGIPIVILSGAEIYATPDLPDLLDEGRVRTLNATPYFLTEFAFDEDPSFCFRILEQCAARGYRPVIAHPERYYFLQDDPQIAYEWCRAGYKLQINKGSLLGRFGPDEKELGMSLIGHGLAACVASDAHRPDWRSTRMDELREILEENFGREYAGLLTTDNPRRILKGQDTTGYTPQSYL